MNPTPKQSRKPADLNKLAAAIVGDATDENRPDLDGKRAVGKK